MFNWLRKRNPAPSGVASPSADSQGWLRLQQAYWAPDPSERASLLARYPGSLNWPELLRLHHLICIDLALGPGRAELEYPDADDEVVLPPDSVKLASAIASRLVSPESPYRPRPAALWGKIGESDSSPPRHQGQLSNASITHLGSLEIIRIDQDQNPIEVAFVGLDEIRGAALASPALFRLGKIFYECGRPDEMVVLPQLHGLSWRTGKGFDTDGSMTRFCCHMRVDGLEKEMGICLGQQDLTITGDSEATLFGIASVGEIMVPLSVGDPKFDEKCRGRGLDPVAVRRQVEVAG